MATPRRLRRVRRRSVVRPHRNSVAHGKPPEFAIFNHAAVDSGIPRATNHKTMGFSCQQTIRRHYVAWSNRTNSVNDQGLMSFTIASSDGFGVSPPAVACSALRRRFGTRLSLNPPTNVSKR